MKTRVYNFSAGPAMLPEAVMREVQAELLNWHGSGMSVMEIGHRTAPYIALMELLEADFRDVMSIPDNYHVLFLGGAARTQFAMIPMNFLSKKEYAGYLISGIWSSLAYDEARKLKQAYCVGTSKKEEFTDVPDPKTWQLRDHTSYLYYTPNETINGVRFRDIPSCPGVPLIADMTSSILSEPIDVSKFGLIFAGAQKNIANAGLTIVIVRDDLVHSLSSDVLPTMMDYRTFVNHHSLYATPPTFNCYIAQKMLQWIKKQGGVDALYPINVKKAEALYQYIDDSTFYQCRVEKNARSLMNVCFTLTEPSLEQEFLKRAVSEGLCGLQGHRTVGGLRASLYNAMPMEGVDALIAFMQSFSEEFHQ